MGMSGEVERSTDCHEDDRCNDRCYICAGPAVCRGYGGFLCKSNFCKEHDRQKEERSVIGGNDEFV
jgi:hypothetical protein